MSNVQMPESVAVVVSDFAIFWAGSGPIAPLVERNDVRVGSQLITTSQAEAYAKARVREALEKAASICEAAYEQDSAKYAVSRNPYFEGGCGAAEFIEQKILALIPKELT